MSNETMTQAKHKNDHIHQKHIEEMKTLLEKEKIADGIAEREIKSMRDDFRAQLAYQYVYKNHSFKKYDQAKKKARPTSDKPELYEQLRKPANPYSTAPRPLGSLREVEMYKDELKNIHFPPISDKAHEKRNKVNVFGDNTYEHIKEGKKEVVKNQTAFPNIETALGVEVKYKHKCKQELQEKDSLYSAPAGAFDDTTEVGKEETAHVVEFNMGQNLILMRKKAQEQYERHRLLPKAPPPSREATKLDGWRRVLPPTPSRPSSVFPDNTKNAIGMKKWMKNEVNEVVSTWTSTHRRLEKVEKVKEYNKNHHEKNPLPMFDGKRPTSAIIRDFEKYRKFNEELLRQQEEEEQPIIIRQLSPLPRPESPVSQKRTEYSRITTPLAKTRPHVLHRADSENIPSVSRTASYRDPRDNSGIHENALLTAAERIQLEKVMRNGGNGEVGEHDTGKYKLEKEVSKRPDSEKIPSVSRSTSYQDLPAEPHIFAKLTAKERIEIERRMCNAIDTEEAAKSKIKFEVAKDKETGRAGTPRPKPRRQLPQTPDRSQGRQPIMLKTGPANIHRRLPEPMFNTAILGIDKEDKAIDKVMEANEVELEIPDETGTLGDEYRKLDRKDEDSEINSYSPIAKRKGTPKIMRVSEHLETDKNGFMSTVSKSNMTARLARKMQFNYDAFSRTTPDAKKTVEMRAKMRKKIQMKNEKLAEEMKRKKYDLNSTTGERPRSRVSFNENVIVFQTI